MYQSISIWNIRLITVVINNNFEKLKNRMKILIYSEAKMLKAQVSYTYLSYIICFYMRLLTMRSAEITWWPRHAFVLDGFDFK